MSLKDCIDNAANAGEISREEADRLKKRYDDLARKVLSKGAAKKQLIEELEAEALEKKRRALLTEQRRKDLVQQIFAHKNRTGELDPADALLWLVEHHGQAGFQDAESRRLSILGMAHTKFEEALYDFRKGALKGDYRRQSAAVAAKLENVVKELFGEDSGDARAKGLARSWSTVADDLRQRFNAAGGAVRKLEKWGLPQSHNREALIAAGRDKWVETITPMLDPDRMLNQITGQPMTGDELAESLLYVWDQITTDGWMNREPSGQRFGQGSLAKRHADHRFLHFKNADAWLKYQRDFGEGDPFAAMMSYIGSMSRDIAAMEVFGPNPTGMREYLSQLVTATAAKKKPVDRIIAEKSLRLKDLSDQLAFPRPVKHAMEKIGELHQALDQLRRKSGGRITGDALKERDRLLQELFAYRETVRAHQEGQSFAGDELVKAEIADILDTLDGLHKLNLPAADPQSYAASKIQRADQVWDSYSGALNTPVNAKWANVLQNTRSLISSISLGSAVVSAVSDTAFGAMTRAYVGLPVMSMVGDMVAAFKPANRREAVRAGLILDSAQHVLHSQARYVGAIASRNIPSFLADRVIGLQGLSAWTQAGKHAFGMAFQAEVADRVLLPFSDLPELLRQTFTRHGIDAAAWDKIRTARLYEPEAGATFLRPVEIQAAAGRDLAERYLQMIIRETKFAVPEPTHRSTSLMTAGTRRGTIGGEMVRSFTQLKSFGAVVLLMHAGRTARELGAGRIAKGGAYAGMLLFTSSILGAFAIQLKELVQGRDPRDMRSAGFVGASILQGGGLGIFGDFLFANRNRVGGGLAQTIAGPMVDKVSQALELTIGNSQQAAVGDKTNIGREATEFLRKNTPGGNIWWLRAAYERIAIDQLQTMADPRAREAFKRKMTNRKRDYGNDFWWAPGTTSPQRGPRIEGAFGG